jgi:flavorubredoxin
MVHWPEVMMTYDSTEKVLFSADGFGKFGALDVEEDWACEARRYYFGIVGKYGVQVQTALKSVSSGLDIRKICPLHGPVLEENIDYYISKYLTWSAYLPENDGIVIAYTSIYGNTKKAVQILADKLRAKGCPEVLCMDLSRTDWSEAVATAFRFSKLVLATTTYNSNIFPAMKQFIDYLTERGYKNRTIGFIENGSWAPTALKLMKSMLEGSKNLTFIETSCSIRSAMNKENENQLEEMANQLCIDYLTH